MHQSLVGLIPAAGRATRLGLVSTSKEIIPVCGLEKTKASRRKPVCTYLLKSMRLAGARRALIVIRRGKWDIPNYLGSGKFIGLNLGYLLTETDAGVPFTLDQAYHHLDDHTVLFGFPDIVFQPPLAYGRIIEKQIETGADLTLGLFPAHRPKDMDLVKFGSDGTVNLVVPKPAETDLDYAWILAVWRSSFSKFLHLSLQEEGVRASTSGEELFIGNIFNRAIDYGLHVDSVCFPTGEFIDIGTPEDLHRAVKSG